jgi:hypothetical protein
MTYQITIPLIMMLVLYVVSPTQRSRRAEARVAARNQRDERLAANHCPTCDGAPFDQILMNGLTDAWTVVQKAQRARTPLAVAEALHQSEVV